MSEKTEKLVRIIIPDLLNYLDMIESGEIIEKRLRKNILLTQKEEKEENIRKSKLSKQPFSK